MFGACSESVGGLSGSARGVAAAVPARPRRRPEVSAAADGSPEADPIARRRRGGHKTPHNVTSHPLRYANRYFGPSTASYLLLPVNEFYFQSGTDTPN